MAAIVDAANTAVTGLGGGRYRIEKTGGVDGQFDASAVSPAAAAGDFILEVADLGAPNNAIFGVAADPGEGTSYEQIDHAIQLIGSDLYIYERSVWMPPSQPHAGRAWIVRAGSVLRYLVGDDPATALVARTVTGSVAPLRFDSTIAKTGGAIEVRFEPLMPAQQRIALTLGMQF